MTTATATATMIEFKDIELSTGVRLRYADAGYEEALDEVKKKGIARIDTAAGGRDPLGRRGLLEHVELLVESELLDQRVAQVVIVVDDQDGP